MNGWHEWRDCIKYLWSVCVYGRIEKVEEESYKSQSTSTSLVSSLLGIILQWILCILRRPTAGRGGRT